MLQATRDAKLREQLLMQVFFIWSSLGWGGSASRPGQQRSNGVTRYYNVEIYKVLAGKGLV